MSIRIINWVFQEEKQTHGEVRLLLLALADQANDEGYTWPSLNTLARKINADRSSVIRASKQLEQLGLLTVIHRTIGTRNQSNMYRVIWNKAIKDEEITSGRWSPGIGGSAMTPPPIQQGSVIAQLGGVSQCDQGGSAVTPESLINHQLTTTWESWRKFIERLQLNHPREMNQHIKDQLQGMHAELNDAIITIKPRDNKEYITAVRWCGAMLSFARGWTEQIGQIDVQEPA